MAFSHSKLCMYIFTNQVIVTSRLQWPVNSKYSTIPIKVMADRYRYETAKTRFHIMCSHIMVSPRYTGDSYSDVSYTSQYFGLHIPGSLTTTLRPLYGYMRHKYVRTIIQETVIRVTDLQDTVMWDTGIWNGDFYNGFYTGCYTVFTVIQATGLHVQTVSLSLCCSPVKFPSSLTCL